MGESMNYCENCHRVSDQTRCEQCGRRKLRPVREDDFCFLTEDHASRCQSLIETFEADCVPCVSLPCGSGVGTRAALPLPNRQLFVPFRFLESAQKSLIDRASAATEAWRAYLLESASELFLSQKLEKKLLKKLQMSNIGELLAYCVEIIKTADRISEEGRITSCAAGGCYVFCFSDRATLSINSKTYEVISLTVSKARR